MKYLDYPNTENNYNIDIIMTVFNGYIGSNEGSFVVARTPEF